MDRLRIHVIPDKRRRPQQGGLNASEICLSLQILAFLLPIHWKEMLKRIQACQSSTESTALQNGCLQTSKRSTETPVAKFDGWEGKRAKKKCCCLNQKLVNACKSSTESTALQN